MRIKLISILCVFIFLPAQSMALEPINEAHAMFYYQVPFSVNKAKEKKHSFGFRMDHTSYGHGGMIQYQQLMKKPAAFDFKMGHEGVEGMYVAGVDYLQLYRLKRAAEEESEDADAPVKKNDSPSTASKAGTMISDNIEEIWETVPLGFMIGGVIGIVLLTGAGG